MENFSDKTRAYLYALLVHLAVFVSLFLGLFWVPPAPALAMVGPPIEATLIGPSAAPPARPVKPQPAPPKPVEPAPEPPKPPEAKQPPPTVQRNDNQDQEKIAEIAQQKAEQAKRAEEEKVRQKQILLDEEKKRQEAEAKQQIQKQLEDIRKERETAAKQTKLAQEKLKQLDDLQKQQSQVKRPPAEDVPEAPERKTGTNGTDTSLLAAYTSAIQKVVTENWNRPDTAAPGVRCAVRIIQIPGGTVINTTISTPCNADAVTQNSIIQAVTKAQPLPYKGYESVFQREIIFKFTYDGN